MTDVFRLSSDQLNSAGANVLVSMMQDKIIKKSAFHPAEVNVDKAKKILSAWLANPNHYAAYLMHDGRFAGVFLGHVYSLWFSDSIFAIDDLAFTLPDFRGAGIGRALVEDFKLWAKEKNAIKIYLINSLGIDDEAASRMYKAVGAKFVGSVYSMDL